MGTVVRVSILSGPDVSRTQEMVRRPFLHLQTGFLMSLSVVGIGIDRRKVFLVSSLVRNVTFGG